MEPEKDSKSFLALLKVYRELLNYPGVVTTSGNLHDKFGDIFTAFLSEKLVHMDIGKQFTLINECYQSQTPYVFGFLNNNPPPPVDRDTLKQEIDKLLLWRKKNEVLCDRLKEKDFETYRANINLLVKDANYDAYKTEEY